MFMQMNTMALANNDNFKRSPDDIITISESEDSKDGFNEDFQIIEADLIDDGVSEDETEQDQLNSQSPVKNITHTSVIYSSNEHFMHHTKKLCLRIVDIKKYPWYYTKQINRMYFNTAKQVATENYKVSLSESSVPVSNKKDTSPIVKESDTRAKNDTTQNQSSDSSLCKIEIPMIAKNVKIKKQIQEGKSTSDFIQQRPIKIDVKKNIGLVGMKIRPMDVNIKTTEKKNIKTYNTKCGNKRMKNNGKTATESYYVEKETDEVNAMKKNTIAVSEETGNTATEIIKGGHNNYSDHSCKSKFSENRFREMNISLKCSLKIPAGKIDEVIKKCEETRYSPSLTKQTQNKYTSDSEYNVINSKLTENPIDVFSLKSQKNCRNIQNYNRDEYVDNTRSKPMPMSKKLKLISKKKHINKQINKTEMEQTKVFTSVVENTKTNNDLNLKIKSIINNNKTKFNNTERAPNFKQDPENYTSTNQKIAQISKSLNKSNFIKDKETVFDVSFTKLKSDASENQNFNSNIGTAAYCSLQNCTDNCDSAIIKNDDMKKMNYLASPFVHETVLCKDNKTISLTDNCKTADNVYAVTNLTLPPINHNELEDASKPQLLDSKRKQTLKKCLVSNNRIFDDYLQVDRINKAVIKSAVPDPIQAIAKSYVHEDKMKIVTAQSLISRPQQEVVKLQQDIRQNLRNIENMELNAIVKPSSHPNEQQILNKKQKTNIQQKQDNNNKSLVYSPTPQSTQMHNRTQQSLNYGINNVFLGTMQFPYYGSSTNQEKNISKKLPIMPPFISIPQKRQYQITSRQVRPIINPLKYRSHVCSTIPYWNPQMTPIRNEHNSGFIQNNNGNASHTSQNMLGNENLPPGIRDVQTSIKHFPQNTNSPSARTPLTPPQNLQNQYNCNNFTETSIIGKNKNGIVKKINISNYPLVPENDTESIEKCLINEKVDYDSTTTYCVAPGVRPAENKPVLSKPKVTEVLEKAVTFENPVTNLKSPCALPSPSNPVKRYKPGPLSKKIKLSNYIQDSFQNNEQVPLHKQYSPPILPIPTYETVLSKAKPPIVYEKPSLIFNKNSAENSDIETNVTMSLSNRRPNQENCKKISLAEYKMRLN